MGFNLDAHDLPAGVTMPLDDEEIDILLDYSIDIHERELDSCLPWWRGMDEVRQRVMLNMAFNLGIPKLLQFHNTLACMMRGDYKNAANGMRKSKWYGQVGRRAERLCIAMESGVMPNA